jgi:hypothetical protein
VLARAGTESDPSTRAVARHYSSDSSSHGISDGHSGAMGGSRRRRRGGIVTFMTDATVEALDAFRAATVRAFTLRSFCWTDERYAPIRQLLSHERARGPGEFPK